MTAGVGPLRLLQSKAVVDNSKQPKRRTIKNRALQEAQLVAPNFSERSLKPQDILLHDARPYLPIPLGRTILDDELAQKMPYVG